MKIEEKMKALLRNWDEKADECAALVQDGLLTADEAAQCLQSADMKKREELDAPPGHSIEIAYQAIDSRLPGYDGLAVGRHV